MNGAAENRRAVLDGAFRIARDPAGNALLQVLLAHQPVDNSRSAAELRGHVNGVIFGLQQMLAAETMLHRFSEELGDVLYGLTTGSEDALVAIVTHLQESLRSQVPPALVEDLLPSIARLIARVMAGWIGRSLRTPENRDMMVRAIREHEEQSAGEGILRSVMDQATVGLRVFHLQSGAVIVHNAAMQSLFGYTLEEELTLPPEKMKNKESADDDFDLFADMVAGRIPYVERISARPHKDGHSVPFRMLGWPVRDSEGRVTHIADIFTPIVSQSSETAGAGLAEKRTRYLLQISPDPIVIATEDGIVRYASPSVESVFGCDADWLIGRHIGVLVHETSYAVGQQMMERCLAAPRIPVLVELQAVLQDGSTRWHEIVATNLLDVEDVQGIVLQGRDITERRTLQQELERTVRTDSLTGLLNRRGFDERLHAVRDQFEESPVTGNELALICYIDLDDFKRINDCFGHAAGDLVLATVGANLGDLVHEMGFAGRMGGDEFILFVRLADEVSRESFRTRLTAALIGAIEADGVSISYSGSYGTVVADRRAMRDRGPARLIRDADNALSEAKILLHTRSHSALT